MPREIDERIVDMQFQNRQFEEGIRESLSSLDNLKKGLASLDGGSLSGLAAGIQAVGERFSTMGVIAATTIQNITNRVVNLASELLKSLTIQPIFGGYEDYERKLTSVQTIMNATGETIETVTGYFDQLDEYADLTIYDLDDMTSAFAKFTNAGVDMDKSVPAIKGIANMVALAGQDANAAAIAMYNLSQSIAGGFLTTMDYRSLNLANVATKEWKEQMIGGAMAAETLKKNASGLYQIKGAKKLYTEQQLFTEALSTGWATTEVLLDVLGDYGDVTTEIGAKAQSAAQDVKSFSMMMDTLKASVGTSWTESFELILGDLNESKILFTDLTKAVGGFLDASANVRNELLRGWKDLGGRDSAIQSFVNAFDAIQSIVAPVKEAFRDFFPATTAEQLFAITKNIEEFTEKLKIGGETSDKLRRTFSGLFAALDLVGQGAGFVFNVAKELFGLFGGPAASSILDVTANFGDFLVTLHDTVIASGVFTQGLEDIRAAFSMAADKIKEAVKRIKDAIGGFSGIDVTPLEIFGKNAELRLRPFEAIGKIVGIAFEALVKVLEWGAPIIKKLGEIVTTALSRLVGLFGDVVQNLDFQVILDLINTGLFGGIMFGIHSFIEQLRGSLGDASDVLDGIKGVLDGVRDSLEAYQNNLKSKTLLTIASAVAVLAAALLVISLIDGDKLAGALAGITVLFLELSASMVVLNKSLGSGEMVKVATQLIAMSTAILILSAAVKNLSNLDWEQLARGTIAIGALMGILVLSANMLDTSSGKMMKGATGLVIFSAAIVVLTKAVSNLAILSWEQLAIGLTGLTVILAEVTAMTHLMGDAKRMISTGLGMTALAAAMLIFAKAVKSFAEMRWDEIARGLTAMAGALAAVTLAMNLLPSGMVGKATGMVIVGSALLIIANAMEQFNQMQWEEIARGLTAMAGALLSITYAMSLLPEGMIAKSVGLIAVAAALKIMIEPLTAMVGMSWEEIAKGLTTLAVSMGILAVSMNAMQSALPGASAMLILVAALRLFVPILQELGSMPVGEIVKGLLTLAATFAVIGAAAFILAPLVPMITGLAGAISLLGLGVALVGGGVLALSAGLAALSVGASAAASAITIIVSALLNIIPMLFVKLGEALIAFAGVIINGAPAIKEAFMVLMSSALEVITELTPMIVNAIFGLILSILDSLDTNLPLIVDKLFSVITGFLNELAARMPELILAGANLMSSFLNGIFEVIGDFKPENLLGVIACFTLLIAAFKLLASVQKDAIKALVSIGIMAAIFAVMTALFAVLASLDIDSVLDISLGLSAVLVAVTAAIAILGAIPASMALGAVTSLATFIGGLALVITAFGALKQIPGVSWLLSEGATFMSQIGDAIGGFVGSIIGGVLTSITSSFPQVATDLSTFMDNLRPFLEGTKNIDNQTLIGVKALADTVLTLTGAGILSGLTDWLTGGSAFVQFGKQLADFAPYFSDYYDQIKDIDGGVVTASANAALALAEFAQKVPAHGGLVEKITGDNSIAAFAEELVAFGPKLKAYADSVTGLEPNVVTNSSNAALALAEMANNLPRQGGLIGWFKGDASLSSFGEELANFGPYLSDYARSVSGLSGDVVQNSANAAKALTELANNLPTSGGFLSLFTGDKSLANFGTELSKFGAQLSLYSTSIQDVNFDKIKSVTDSISALLALTKDITSANISGLSTFAQDLRTQGDLGLTGFLAAFDNSASRIQISINTVTAAILDGFAKGTPLVIKEAESLITAISVVLVSKSSDVSRSGQILLVSLSSTLAQDKSVMKSAETLATNVVAALHAQQPYFVQSGEYFVDGLVIGINNKTPMAIQAGIQLASNLLKSVNDELGIHSPATTGKVIGGFFVGGVAEGLKDNVVIIGREGQKLGSALVSSVQNALMITDGPSKIAQDECGRYFVEGLANGIKQNTTAEAASKQLAQNVVSAFKTELDRISIDVSTIDLGYKLWESLNQNITGPSRYEAEMGMLVDKIELQNERVLLSQGEYLATLDLFGDTSTETKNAYNKFLQEQINLSELQNQYANVQRSASNYQKEAANKQISNLSATIELEYQLWAAMNKNASVAEQEAVKMGLLADQISLQNQRVLNAQSEYVQSVSMFGEASNDAQTAYQSFLQEQIRLTEMVSEVQGYQDTYAEQQRVAAIKYFEYYQKNAKLLEELGMSQESIQSSAREYSGYDPDWMETKMSDNIVDAATSAMDIIANTYEKQAASKFGELTNDFGTWGKEYAVAMGDGLTNNTALATGSINIMASGMIEALSSHQEQFTQTAYDFADGFIIGLQAKYQEIAEAGYEAGRIALAAMRNALNTASPSKETEKLGIYFDLGFINGMLKYSKTIETTAEKVSENALDTFRDSLAGVYDILASDIDASPVITPVIDITGVKASTDLINAMLSKTRNIDISGTAQIASNARVADRTSFGQTVNGASSGASQQFIFQQNNYSPKALSRLDIYRQTKNQFSAFKEAVKTP